MRLFLVLIPLLFCGCQTTVKKFDEHALYEKMRQSSLVLLVNDKENGSAAFISPDGYAVSAAHCIRYRDDKLDVISPVHGRLSAKFVAFDKAHDMLLIKVDVPQPVTFLPPSLKKPRTPEKVYQIGSPIYRRGVVQSGFIARDDTFFEYYGDHHDHYVEIIHVSATVQGGTSGGPWVNKLGEFIGVQSGTLLVGDSPSGIAFMAPVNSFLSVIQDKKSARSRNLDFRVLPIEAHDSNTIKRYKGFKEGLVVADIDESSTAKKAGLNKWDLIVAINDRPVKTTKEMMEIIRNSSGDNAMLTVVPLDEGKSTDKSIPIDYIEDRITFKSIPSKVSTTQSDSN